MGILDTDPPPEQQIDMQKLLQQLSQASGSVDTPSGSIDTQVLLARLSQLEKQNTQLQETKQPTTLGTKKRQSKRGQKSMSWSKSLKADKPIN